MEESGITARNLIISRSALLAMIQRYTQEAGLRQLEREIASICRKVARQVASAPASVVAEPAPGNIQETPVDPLGSIAEEDPRTRGQTAFNRKGNLEMIP